MSLRPLRHHHGVLLVFYRHLKLIIFMVNQWQSLLYEWNRLLTFRLIFLLLFATIGASWPDEVATFVRRITSGLHPFLRYFCGLLRCLRFILACIIRLFNYICFSL